ncbi:DUF58 domain-containing protein [Halobacteriaceae archaeon GCM10025711]
MSDAHRTHRWRGVVAVGLLAFGVGIVADRPVTMLLAVLGVVFATYPRLTPSPDPDLELHRQVSDATPGHGDDVEVEVTVTNAGDGVLPDLRVVDGVPPALTVVDGSPRCGMVLWPGRSVTFSYSVRAQRGHHAFDPATVVSRDLSGAVEVETTVATDTELDVATDMTRAPVRAALLDGVGSILADQGGSGIEFYRTREYRRGDAMNRIDWNRYAGTGTLSTVEFREEQSATVVVVVDARAAAYRGGDDDPHAVAHAVTAADQLVQALMARRNRVGLASFGRDVAWQAPGVGMEHRDRLRTLLASHPAFTATPPAGTADHDDQRHLLRERLPSAAQVVLVSPLTDDDIVDTARVLEAAGHPVTVVSPDVTAGDTPGQRLAAIERANRVSSLRRSEIAVYDWEPTDHLAATLDRARERMSP